MFHPLRRAGVGKSLADGFANRPGSRVKRVFHTGQTAISYRDDMFSYIGAAGCLAVSAGNGIFAGRWADGRHHESSLRVCRRLRARRAPRLGMNERKIVNRESIYG